MKKLFKSMSIRALFVYFVFQNSASHATKIPNLEENLRGQILPRIHVENLPDKTSDGLFSYVLRRCLFKCVHFIVQSFVSYTTKKQDYVQIENSFKKILDEIFSHILRHLSARDLSRFGATSKQLYQQKANHQNNTVNALIFSTQQDDDLSSLVGRQFQMIDPLKLFRGDLGTLLEQQMISKITANIGQKNQCAFVLTSSPLNLYLNQALLTGNRSHDHFTGFILYQHHKAYFDQELFPDESDETYKAIVAQHLFSQIALYIPKADQDMALNSFFNRNKSAISKYLKNIDTANNWEFVHIARRDHMMFVEGGIV